jgi:RNA polymerase sigma factor (sigma-70 family)
MGFLLLQHPRRRDLATLLAQAKTAASDDTPEMAEIIRRFEGLAVNIVAGIGPADQLWDDLLNAARMGLVSAVRHHDGRPQFPGLAKFYMRGAALRELARWTVPESAHSNDLDELHAGRARPDEIESSDDRLSPWGAGPVAEAVASLGRDQMNLIDLRYRHDLPVVEIAAAVGTSGPAVSQRLATIHRRVALAIAA